jgi:hypothetical protein
MYKLIVILAALVPLILLWRTIFGARSKKASRAFSEFKKQIDLLVWVILFIIGCATVYSIGELIHFLMAMTLRECCYSTKFDAMPRLGQWRVLKLGELSIRRSA